MEYQVQEMRQIICQTMENGENKKDLSPILYYDEELLLSPDEWIELMGEENDHRLACDLPFVQLAAKLIKRNISLLIIKQKDVENRKGKSIPERQLQIAQTRYCKATNKSRDATFIDLQLISHHVAVQLHPGLAFKD